MSKSALPRHLSSLSRHPFVLATCLLLLLVLPTVGLRDLWLPDETRHGSVLRNMVESGHWLVLYLGDRFYPDKPPLFFWLAALIALLTGSTAPFVLIAATWLSALAFLGSMILAGKAFGFRRRTLLLAVLILFSNWFFLERVQSPRMDLLFAAFMTLSSAALFLATERTGRGRLMWSLAGFGAAGLAMLTKGPVGPLLPLLTLIVFVARERRLALLRDPAFLAGSLLLFAIAAAYVAGVLLMEGPEFLRAVLVDQTLVRAVAATQLHEPFYFYLLQVPVALLPWSFVLLALPWSRLTQKSFWKQVPRPAESRQRGVSWCVVSVATSILTISLFHYKIYFLILTFCPQLILLVSAAIGRLSRRARRRGFTAMALILILVSLFLPFAPTLTLWPDRVRGEWFVALGLLVGSVALFLLRRGSPLRFAAAAVGTIFLAALPFYSITIPGLNDVMSPRAQAAILAREMQQGRPAFYLHPYRDGIYDFHAGRIVTSLRSLDQMREAIMANPAGVVAMPRAVLDSWPDRPTDMAIIDERSIDAQLYVILRWDRENRAAPAG